MKNALTKKLQKLVGLTIESVEVGTAHGEVLRIIFTDGNRLNVCSTHGLDDPEVPDDPNDICVSINGENL